MLSLDLMRDLALPLKAVGAEVHDSRGVTIATADSPRRAALIVALANLGISSAEAIEAERAARGARWQQENREAIEACNRWVEEHGLPLSEYRLF